MSDRDAIEIEKIRRETELLAAQIKIAGKELDWFDKTKWVTLGALSVGPICLMIGAIGAAIIGGLLR